MLGAVLLQCSRASYRPYREEFGGATSPSSTGSGGQQARMLDAVEAGVADFVASDGPMVLDIRVSRSVISVPNSRLWFGEDV
jgi:hypothetical protein